LVAFEETKNPSSLPSHNSEVGSIEIFAPSFFWSRSSASWRFFILSRIYEIYFRLCIDRHHSINSTHPQYQTTAASTMSDKEEEVVIKQFPWHASTQDECFKELGLDDTLPSKGLSSEEATSRLETYGRNQMTAKETVSLLQKIWAQVANVLVGILVFVAVVSIARAATADGDKDQVTTNSIQVALIAFVIT
jgi:magnesium-transporting ATPase (P-type)